MDGMDLLAEMGFAAADAEQALADSGGDLSAAVAILSSAPATATATATADADAAADLSPAAAVARVAARAEREGRAQAEAEHATLSDSLRLSHTELAAVNLQIAALQHEQDGATGDELPREDLGSSGSSTRSSSNEQGDTDDEAEKVEEQPRQDRGALPLLLHRTGFLLAPYNPAGQTTGAAGAALDAVSDGLSRQRTGCGTFVRRGWCSWCYELGAHECAQRARIGRSRYACVGCYKVTLRCRNGARCGRLGSGSFKTRTRT